MIRNLGLALLSVLVALAACEVLLRVFGAEVLPRPDLYLTDAELGKRMRPGWEGSEFEAPVVINSKGLRSPETPYEKPAGVYRILALGDSWTFGFRMNEPDAYPRQLERDLNARAAMRGETRRFEVINAGVIGYSTDQEAAYLRVEGWKYQPDLVLVNYYPVNDTHNKLAMYRRRAQIRALHPWLLALAEAPKQLYLRQFWKGVRRTLKAKLRVARAGGDPKRSGDGLDRGVRGGLPGLGGGANLARGRGGAGERAQRSGPDRAVARRAGPRPLLPGATTRRSRRWSRGRCATPGWTSSTSSRRSRRGRAARTRCASDSCATRTPTATGSSPRRSRTRSAGATWVGSAAEGTGGGWWR